ncbi:aldolase catalytic domain-containing protein [Enterococcus faecium]|uniref:Aldolase catalytic domain-containing protein n=1 Tax=Enterococcus faecium TaxID=1352 RepID=A0AAW8RNT3_ENTFC|nr:aldolase catalytic domain-containing protein [Enterococcus faecium]MDT2370756.1 aldolase catalytic domain-containing protein [Enterococcus faecium]
MNNLKVLDVTLRDGGCVNDFNFGETYMKKILAAEEASGIDIIEMGYIDECKGSVSGRTQYINEKIITKCILKHKKPGVTYVAMIDYGKFNIDNLENRTENGIDGIRMAFHKKNINEIIPLGRKIIEKGYQLFIQPMITLRYSDSELLELIEMVNDKLPDASAFYIVDSFGEMRPNDVSRILNLVDHNLIPSIPLGLHSHNNLQMSYSNAIAMLQFPTTRDLLLDCSIMGMGKGAGNLNTELLLEHLNLYYGKEYKIIPLLEVIDKVINQIHSEFHWGYSPEYYLSAVNQCTPSYASHFYNKHMLPIDQVKELLGMIASEKKISYDKNYAEKLYRQYKERKSVDDSAVIE